MGAQGKRNGEGVERLVKVEVERLPHCRSSFPSIGQQIVAISPIANRIEEIEDQQTKTKTNQNFRVALPVTSQSLQLDLEPLLLATLRKLKQGGSVELRGELKVRRKELAEAGWRNNQKLGEMRGRWEGELQLWKEQAGWRGQEQKPDRGSRQAGRSIEQELGEMGAGQNWIGRRSKMNQIGRGKPGEEGRPSIGSELNRKDERGMEG